MNKKWTLILLPLVLLAGCAGNAYEMLAADTISASATNVKTGVTALVTTVSSDTAKDEAAVANEVGDAVVLAYNKGKTSTQPAIDPAVMKAAVAVAMQDRIGKILEQQKRLSALTAVISDELAFIQQNCQQLKDFVVYRSNIDQQWQSYLKTVAAGKLSALNAAINPSTGATK